MSGKEIEIKLKTESLNQVKSRAVNLGFETISSRKHEYNIVFDTQENRFRDSKQLLRLRKSGNIFTVTFKRPVSDPDNDNYKIREETESKVDDFDKMRSIFSLMGYREVFIYEKYREVMKLGNLEIMLDETPVGNYIELEGTSEDIDKTAKDLGFSREDYILSNYLSIFREEGNTGDMVFSQ